MWKDLFGYEDRFEVTRCGRIRSKKRKIKNYPSGFRVVGGNEIIGNINAHGYKVFTAEKGKHLFFHRAVALTYINRKSDDLVVNHIDGNKLNNNVENLEWCTKVENHKHAWESGLCNSQKKQVICFNDSGFGIWFPSMHYPKWCNPSLIHAAINGRQKTHRGYMWDYCEYKQNLDKQEC